MNFSEAMFYENYLVSDTVISRRDCLFVKMASKTVIRPISFAPPEADRFFHCSENSDLIEKQPLPLSAYLYFLDSGHVKPSSLLSRVLSKVCMYNFRFRTQLEDTR